jgi:dienelactone hydrolase
VATKRHKKIASRLTTQISIVVAGLLLFNTAAFGDTPFRDQVLSVPMVDGKGNTRHLAGRLCLPDGSTGNARLVLINHGSSDPRDRPNMRPAECSSETAQWFLQRGFAVAFVLRRGFGTTGGTWEEDAGPCNRPDFVRPGLESARDIEATIAYVTSLPGVRPDGAVVAGVSAGGWATLAYNAVSHPRVVALLDFAGGLGGHHGGHPNDNCAVGALVDAAGFFAKTATTPMLWVYAQNDSFFRPEIAGQLYQGYLSQGGKADYQAMPGFGNEGHHLLMDPGGSAVWGPVVEKYLQDRGVLDANGKAL